MATSSKAKKKARSAKKSTRAKSTASARRAKAARPESDDASESLRASARSFAARLLR